MYNMIRSETHDAAYSDIINKNYLNKEMSEWSLVCRVFGPAGGSSDQTAHQASLFHSVTRCIINTEPQLRTSQTQIMIRQQHKKSKDTQKQPR